MVPSGAGSPRTSSNRRGSAGGGFDGTRSGGYGPNVRTVFLTLRALRRTRASYGLGHGAGHVEARLAQRVGGALAQVFVRPGLTPRPALEQREVEAGGHALQPVVGDGL